MAFGRQFWVVAHRWAGLTIALFLIVAGATGIILPWQKELIRASSPSLSAAEPPHAGARPLDPITLTERVERETGGVVTFVPLSVAPDQVTSLFVSAPPGHAELAYDNVWADPYTGAIRLRTTYGALGEGPQNIVPFLYRVHYSLALGSWGVLAFGVAALVWTVDCFVGFYLTFPVSRPRRGALAATAGGARPNGWWTRWRRAWTIHRPARGYRLNVDLHRAGGLWLWPLLLVFAWSSVGFNLPAVYAPVMAALGATPDFAPPPLATPLTMPPIDRHAAVRVGRALVAEQGRGRGFTVVRDGYLYYQAAGGAYAYTARTTADPSDDDAQTRVWFDARTGRLLQFEGPQGRTTTDAAGRWLTMLHMAAVFGVPYRIFVSCLGAAVVTLSVTGIVIWMRKRTAHILGRANRDRRHAAAAVLQQRPMPAE